MSLDVCRCDGAGEGGDEVGGFYPCVVVSCKVVGCSEGSGGVSDALYNSHVVDVEGDCASGLSDVVV